MRARECWRARNKLAFLLFLRRGGSRWDKVMEAKGTYAHHGCRRAKKRIDRRGEGPGGRVVDILGTGPSNRK